jgi:hypothetical protein
MIEIHSNKDKNIIFEVQVSGINPKELSGHFRLMVDGIEYGFPAEISENSISVDVPALKSIINRPLRSGEKIKAKLELVGNDNYIPCWDDHVVVKSAVTVSEKKKPMVKVITKEDSKPVRSKSIIKESKISKKPTKKNIQITTEHLTQYMERHGTKNKRIQEILLKRCSDKVGDNNKLIFKELYNYYNTGKE